MTYGITFRIEFEDKDRYTIARENMEFTTKSINDEVAKFFSTFIDLVKGVSNETDFRRVSITASIGSEAILNIHHYTEEKVTYRIESDCNSRTYTHFGTEAKKIFNTIVFKRFRIFGNNNACPRCSGYIDISYRYNRKLENNSAEKEMEESSLEQNN